MLTSNWITGKYVQQSFCFWFNLAYTEDETIVFTFVQRQLISTIAYLTDTGPAELKMDLNDFVREVLYSSIVPTLFGDNALPATPVGFKEFKERFIKYDGSFEQGAKLPDLFLPEWAECKNYFIQKFDKLCRNKTSCKQEGIKI